MKYTLLNVSSFKNGLQVPMFRVFDPIENRVFYKAFVYGRDNRGKIISKDTFEHDHRSKVASWRESRAGDAK